MAQLIPVDHDPFAGIDESRAPFGAMSPGEIPEGSLQGRALQSLTTDMAAAPVNAIKQFMDTGSPEASFNVATSLAGGGMAGAEKGAVGALGGRLANFHSGESLRNSVEDMAESIWQSNNGKLKKALEETGRMRMFAERVGYTPEEISQIESMVRDKSSQPFVSQSLTDRISEFASDIKDDKGGISIEDLRAKFPKVSDFVLNRALDQIGVGSKQPLMREATVRGRSGRPLYSEPIRGNPEGLIAEDAKAQDLEGDGELHILHDNNGQVRGIFGSKADAAAARDAKMKEIWNEHGPTYGDEYGGAPPNEWNRAIKQWNKEQPGQRVDPNAEGTWYTMDTTGRNYAGSLLEGKPELQQRLEDLDDEWMNRPRRYPGAGAAARHFEENGVDSEDAAKALFIRKGRAHAAPQLVPVDHDPFAQQ